MPLTLAVVIVFIAVVAVFKVVFEVIVFLNFDFDLDVNAAPIFPDCLENFCDRKSRCCRQ